MRGRGTGRWAFRLRHHTKVNAMSTIRHSATQWVDVESQALPTLLIF
jgi:hypothetical protein